MMIGYQRDFCNHGYTDDKTDDDDDCDDDDCDDDDCDDDDLQE